MERVQRHAYSLTLVPLLGAAAVLAAVGLIGGSIGAYAAGAGVLGVACLTGFWMGIGRLHDLGRPGWHSLGLLLPGQGWHTTMPHRPGTRASASAASSPAESRPSLRLRCPSKWGSSCCPSCR